MTAAVPGTPPRPADTSPADPAAFFPADPAALAALALGDDALVLAQRLGEWAGDAPVLEEDVALTNIALDLLGQARTLLSLVGDEDELAYLREEHGFRNVQLVEQPNGDFADTIARQLYFSVYQELLYAALAAAEDDALAPLAAKAVKEVAYHRDHAEQWTLRLGDGTQESHRRMQRRLDGLWRYTGELFEPLEGLGVDLPALREPWLERVTAVSWAGHAGDTAGPGPDAVVGRGGPAGRAHRAVRTAAGRDAVPAPRAPGGVMVTADPQTMTPLEEELLRLAGAVPDPELPVISLAELGVLRGVRVTGPRPGGGRADPDLDRAAPRSTPWPRTSPRCCARTAWPRSRCAPCSPRPGRPTRSARRGAASSPRPGWPRRARGRRRHRRGPAVRCRWTWRCAARTAARPTPGC